MSRLVLLNTTTTIYSTRQLPNEMRKAGGLTGKQQAGRPSTTVPPSFYGFNPLHSKEHTHNTIFPMGKLLMGKISLYLNSIRTNLRATILNSLVRSSPFAFAQITTYVFFMCCSSDFMGMRRRCWMRDSFLKGYYALERKVLSALGLMWCGGVSPKQRRNSKD